MNPKVIRLVGMSGGMPEDKRFFLDQAVTESLKEPDFIKQAQANDFLICHQAGHVASQCHVGAYVGKHVIVVDDDIDPSNLEEVIWAMVTRSDLATSIDIIHNAWTASLEPRLHPDDKAKGKLVNSRAIIDATRPFEWRDRFPPVNMPSRETMRRAREKFSYLLEGFGVIK